MDPKADTDNKEVRKSGFIVGLRGMVVDEDVGIERQAEAEGRKEDDWRGSRSPS